MLLIITHDYPNRNNFQTKNLRKSSPSLNTNVTIFYRIYDIIVPIIERIEHKKEDTINESEKNICDIIPCRHSFFVRMRQYRICERSVGRTDSA